MSGMGRREFVALLGTAAVGAIAARAQQPTRYRIGHLAIAAPTDIPAPPPANWNAFVQGLAEAGYVEGRNLIFEHRSAHDQPDLFPKLAVELASLKVDVIFARGTWALGAAKDATRTIPIVGIDLEIDPVKAGLATSIARPGGNITGLFLDLSELSGKHLQILKEIIPRTSRVAIFGDPDINASQLRELERVAQSLSMQTRVAGLKNADSLEGAFDTTQNWRADALIVLSNPLSLAYRARIADLAAKAGLPTILPGACGCGRSHLLWARPAGHVSALRRLCWQNFRRHKAQRPADRTPGEVRAGCEPQNRESSRHYYSRNDLSARRRGDRVIRRREFMSYR